MRSDLTPILPIEEAERVKASKIESIRDSVAEP
jgi:hypothetical protein